MCPRRGNSLKAASLRAQEPSIMKGTGSFLGETLTPQEIESLRQRISESMDEGGRDLR